MCTFQTMATLTYRSLPTRSKNKISVSDTYTVLSQKIRYFSSLSYSEKCKMGAGKIAAVIQRRIRKYNLHISKHIIKNILRAEETFYYQEINLY